MLGCDIKMELQQAQQLAETLKAELAPYTDRIEIGGSIRRKKPKPNDIELICIPKFDDVVTGQYTLWEEPIIEQTNSLFNYLANTSDYHIEKMGERYCRFEIFDQHPSGVRQYIKVDLFTATPATWGYIFMLRTGSAKFSRWVVMELGRRGFTPKGGEIFHRLTLCYTPDESEVFNLLELDFIEPEDRTEAQ